jgi:hypothetical protein
MAGQGSARVILNEIDLSQVSSQQVLPQGVPAAVVGPAQKGPAFVPRTFANIQQFNETFGSVTNTKKNGNGNKFGPIALNEWLNNSQAGTYLRVLGVGDGTSLAAGAGFNLGEEQIQNSTGVKEENKFAVIADTDVDRASALTASRTYAFGAFYSDKAGSTQLEDAGIIPQGGVEAAPLVTGLLMTPQGVYPSLQAGSLTTASSLTSGTLIGSITPTSVVSGSTVHDFSTGLKGYQLGEVSDSNKVKLVLNGYKPSGDYSTEKNVYDISLDPDHKDYFSKALNTDPSKMHEKGHCLYSWVDLSLDCLALSMGTLTSSNGATFSNFVTSSAFLMKLDDTPMTDWSSRYTTPKTPWVTSQMFAGDVMTTEAGSAIELFRLHAIDDGAYANNKYRLQVSDIIMGVNDNWSTFTLSLEMFDSDPIVGEALYVWKQATFDPTSRNFIGRLIGDMHTYYDFDRDEGKQTLVTEGFFPVRNPYVRIELNDDVLNGNIPRETVPFGFKPHREISFTSSDFVESNGSNNVFAGGVMPSVSIAPIPYVKTISRPSGGGEFSASDKLAWGLKFANREFPESQNKELSEHVHNSSLQFWTKFYPESALMSDSDAEVANNNYFTMQKIAVTYSNGNVVWDNAEFRRDGVAPAGKTLLSPSDATTKNSRFMKFRLMFGGGFDGLNIFNKNAYLQNNEACVAEAEGSSGTGPTIKAYLKALDVLSDKSATEFQLLAVPGIRVNSVTSAAISACEDRFDAMLVMDIEEKDEDTSTITSINDKNVHVRNTISSFVRRNLDTSFAAAYFPNVVMNKPGSSSRIEVPPSVGMLGAISLNDTLADPWFAPAGLTRGVINASRASVQMNRDVLNDLYDADINPIYVPSGRNGEVYAFGQKTLLQDPSALDRINVRRLLINLRRKVKAVANSLLFEPNRASTLAKFSSLVEPILNDVKKRQGVERYKVQIDTTTTTQNDIENNTIRGKIYLQPTKSVEFISLDFVVSNSID